MTAIYRYPGVKPFEASDAALFFGRERDQTDLLGLVSREKLTVLFGKSGYGKSSLVKAGVIPELIGKPNIALDPETGEEQPIPNCPVYVRLNLYGQTSQASMPCAAVIERLLEKVGKDDLDIKINGFFQQKGINNTLWSAFKSSKTAARERVFLIFDQFEEFFSYPVEAQLQFRRELSELLYTRIPQPVRDQMGDLDRASKSLLHQQMDMRALFIIRSDRIHLLNSMREELPAILHARYELHALNEQQAKDAIVRPAQLSDRTFILKGPFGYEPPALARILSELSKPSDSPYDQGEQRSIEAFQLQMVCQTIEQSLIARTRKSNGVQPTVVKEEDLPNFGQIYEQYYTNRLANLPDADSRQTAHVLLEEVMVIGEEMPDIRRVSMDKELLEETMLHNHQLTVSQELLDYLEDKFLIRRETIGGRVHYEVSHDVLLAPLVNARDEARQRAAKTRAAADAKAQQMAAEQRAKEAEVVAREERKRREGAEQQRRRARVLAAAAIAGFLLATAIGVWAMQEKGIAEQALIKLEIAEAKKEVAEKEKRKQAFYQTISDIETIIKSPVGCPDQGQNLQLDTLPLDYPEDIDLQKRVSDLKTQLRANNCR